MQFFEEMLLSCATLHTRQLMGTLPNTPGHRVHRGSVQSRISLQAQSQSKNILLLAGRVYAKKPTNKQVAMDHQTNYRVLQHTLNPGWKGAPAHSFYQGMVI